MKRRPYVRLVVRQRWWLRWYIDGVSIMAQLSGAEPDEGKVVAAIRRGLVVKVEPANYTLAA